MTEKEVLERVESIRVKSLDSDATAHSLEDALRNEFIAFVAKRKDRLGKIARIVLSTNKIDFSRWHA